MTTVTAPADDKDTKRGTMGVGAKFLRITLEKVVEKAIEGLVQGLIAIVAVFIAVHSIDWTKLREAHVETPWGTIELQGFYDRRAKETDVTQKDAFVKAVESAAPNVPGAASIDAFVNANTNVDEVVTKLQGLSDEALHVLEGGHPRLAIGNIASDSKFALGGRPSERPAYVELQKAGFMYFPADGVTQEQVPSTLKCTLVENGNACERPGTPFSKTEREAVLRSVWTVTPTGLAARQALNDLVRASLQGPARK